jgi:hypothetical protein
VEIWIDDLQLGLDPTLAVANNGFQICAAPIQATNQAQQARMSRKCSPATIQYQTTVAVRTISGSGKRRCNLNEWRNNAPESRTGAFGGHGKALSIQPEILTN